ncbi:MAG: hypothetical protein JST00_40360 [Deltaproteobacteria bacterium]|nr:hypothetical protein [Deltaproteobacteria bacterium]
MRGWLVLVLVAGALSACGDKSGSHADAGADAVVRAHDAGDAASDAGPDDTEMPKPGSDELSARMRHLLEAIAQNNPDLANDVLFPRDAYIAAKDAPDPQKAWEKRVSGTFRRAVEKTHKRNKGIEGAKFVSFELGHQITQLTPKKKDFKKAFWRVKHSKLTYEVDGKTKHLEIAEMTSYRGNWYVTRLR